MTIGLTQLAEVAAISGELLAGMTATNVAARAQLRNSYHDGYAIFKNVSTGGQSGWAGSLWSTFFSDLTDPQKTDADRIRSWGDAEAAGTSYGVREANARGASPNVPEQIFLAVGNEYRAGRLPGELGIVGLIGGAGAGGVAGFKLCGPTCALAGTLVGGIGGAGTGYGIAKYSEDPRNTIPGSNDHPLRPITYVMLYLR